MSIYLYKKTIIIPRIQSFNFFLVETSIFCNDIYFKYIKIYYSIYTYYYATKNYLNLIKTLDHCFGGWIYKKNAN